MSKIRSAVRSIGLLALVIVLAGILQSRNCCAATFYRYVDRNGTVCFTDNLQSIPEEYRKMATAIKDEKSTDNKAKENRETGDSESGPSTYREKIRNALTTIVKSPFFKPVLAAAIFLCLFAIAGKIGRSPGRKRLSYILRIVLVAGIVIYLFYIYETMEGNNFSRMKKILTDGSKKAEERDGKAGDVSRDMPEPESPNR